jgi:hypothetical protein
VEKEHRRRRRILIERGGEPTNGGEAVGEVVERTPSLGQRGTKEIVG